jgi:Fe-S cluster assembly iron-binding protein IscA
MKLISLIESLKDSAKLKQVIVSQNLNVDSEALLIYIKETLDIDSEIRFFEIEETKDNLVFEKDGTRYVQLFSLDFAEELVNSDFNLTKGLSNLEIAERLLDYRKKDA